MRRAPGQCPRTPIAFLGERALRGPCRWTRRGCIRSHAPDTLLLTGRLPPGRLWFRAAWKTQTILLSLKLRSVSRSAATDSPDGRRTTARGIEAAMSVLKQNVPARNHFAGPGV